MIKIKIIITILISSLFVQNTTAQFTPAESCMFIAGYLVLSSGSYRFSPVYGIASNDNLGNGHVVGGEFSWFPLQDLIDSRSRFAYGLKIAYTTNGAYGETKPKASAFLEANYYLKKPKRQDFPTYEPFIGIDIGITDGFIMEKGSNFAFSPIIGCAYNLSSDFSIYSTAKYASILESGRSRLLQFNIGVQYSFD